MFSQKLIQDIGTLNAAITYSIENGYIVSGSIATRLTNGDLAYPKLYIKVCVFRPTKNTSFAIKIKQMEKNISVLLCEINKELESVEFFENINFVDNKFVLYDVLVGTRLCDH